MGSAAEARSASNAKRDTASDRDRRNAGEPVVETRQGGDRSAGGFYTDFTELRFAGGVRKARLIPLLDHATRYVPGFAVGERANSGLALDAWSAAHRTLNPLPRLVRRRDRPPGPGFRVHRLRVGPQWSSMDSLDCTSGRARIAVRPDIDSSILWT